MSLRKSETTVALMLGTTAGRTVSWWPEWEPTVVPDVWLSQARCGQQSRRARAETTGPWRCLLSLGLGEATLFGQKRVQRVCEIMFMTLGF